MITVSLNTRKTFERLRWGWWNYTLPVVFGVDVLITLFFQIEAIVKMKQRGLCKVSYGMCFVANLVLYVSFGSYQFDLCFERSWLVLGQTFRIKFDLFLKAKVLIYPKRTY